MIECDRIAFQYTSGKLVFSDFSLMIRSGERWSVVGGSGCGKSTLLYILAGLRMPSAGVVNIRGEKLTRPRPGTGLILQDYGLLPWATVRDNVQLGLRVRQFYGPDGRHAPLVEGVKEDWNERCESWIKKLGLSEVAESFPGQISGGQRQRTAIARTMALNPDILLMDEPFASLDAATREALQHLIAQVTVERNLTSVLVTHSIGEAALFGQKILILNKPPNRYPLIVENPEVDRKDYSVSEDFQQVCVKLRGSLEAVI